MREFWQMMNLPVLVLNQSCEPLALCRARRAVVLILEGKAEMMENGLGLVHTVHETLPLPSVIRLARMVRRPRHRRRMTRFEIFNRDKYTCQYCGVRSRELTLDHVVPRYRGGEHTWENVVSACAACNRRKAGRTPREANMKLIKPPAPPVNNHTYVVPHRYLDKREEWYKYLPRHARQ
jgi:5-methylcytosine-specific restriction endonuclease McrA